MRLLSPSTRSFAKLDNTPYALSLPTQTFLAGGLGANFFWLGALPGESPVPPRSSLQSSSFRRSIFPNLSRLQTADNVKNRLQTDSLTQPRYSSPLAVVRVIWKEAGWKGFYRGFVPVVLRAFPTK
jgi:solute carrier family 25 carnitine/acylcarnitine transporter 20/29